MVVAPASLQTVAGSLIAAGHVVPVVYVVDADYVVGVDGFVLSGCPELGIDTVVAAAKRSVWAVPVGVFE